MTGLCFFFGGINRLEQAFNVNVAHTVSMMLLLAVFSLVVPTASRLMVSGVTDYDVVVQSRGTSVVILISYCLYLFFQLKTHTMIFEWPSEKNETRDVGEKFKRAVIPEKFRTKTPPQSSENHTPLDLEDEPEEPQLSVRIAVLALTVSTALVALNAEFATGSVQRMVREAGISQTFVGIVIFPILSNDPESIMVAMKDRMHLSISLTLDKCMQTALFIVPLLIIVAWVIGNDDMTLDFDGFPVAITFASILVVAYAVQLGKSNWLIGALLIKIYVIVALATYFVR